MAADDDKKLILARRAKFVAAALAGVSVACGKEPTQPPHPCLSMPIENRDAGPPDPPPMPCLTPMRVEEDAGAAPMLDTDAGSAKDAGTKDAGTPPPKPTPCLAPPLPTNTGTNKPPPRPCLSVVRPPDKESK